MAVVAIFTACDKESVESVENVSAEIGQINFTQPDLFPEGVVYDKFNNRFYVSSLTNGDIGIVDSAGNYSVFISDTSLIATNGLEIDEARKLLYVTNNTGSVGVYNLDDGSRVRLINLVKLLPNAPDFINDVALDAQGNAYVTNSASPVIYKITAAGKASIYFQDDAFATGPNQFGFNGIEYGNHAGGYLLVAYSTANQVVKKPCTDKSAFSTLTLDAALNGPDGLLLSKDGKQLIVVNNAGGAEGNVLSFTTDNEWEKRNGEQHLQYRRRISYYGHG